MKDPLFLALGTIRANPISGPALPSAEAATRRQA
jgi:hypothetical protein